MPSRSIQHENLFRVPLSCVLVSALVPWLMYPVLDGHVADALSPAALVLIGAALAPGLWLWGNRLPRIPVGDIVVGRRLPSTRATHSAPRWRERMRGFGSGPRQVYRFWRWPSF